MSITAKASEASAWRGYEYYINRKVLSWKQSGIDEFYGSVSGTEYEPYEVSIHIEHPEESVCSCPHAEGNRIVCKHKVALYFAVFPEKAAEYFEGLDDYEREEEERELDRYEEIVSYVNSLTKAELRYELIESYVEAERKSRNRRNRFY